LDPKLKAWYWDGSMGLRDKLRETPIFNWRNLAFL
jgi:hypothetical protein